MVASETTRVEDPADYVSRLRVYMSDIPDILPRQQVIKSQVPDDLKYRVAFCKTEITFTGPWSVGTCFPQDLPLYRELLLLILYTVYGVS